jgi:hypothetical protein
MVPLPGVQSGCLNINYGLQKFFYSLQGFVLASSEPLLDFAPEVSMFPLDNNIDR